MSELRNQLQAEKERHHGMVYPGNLTQELLGAAKVKQASMMDYADAGLRRRTPLLRWLLALGGAGAVAAAIAIVVWTNSNSTPPIVVSEAQPTFEAMDQDEEVPLALTETESMPTDVPVMLSSAGSITPEYQSMSFSSIPSFSDLSTSSEDISN